jgi:hypothetical protein
MIYFYYAKMQRGNQKIRGKATTLEMLVRWINKQIELGFELVGDIYVKAGEV